MRFFFLFASLDMVLTASAHKRIRHRSAFAIGPEADARTGKSRERELNQERERRHRARGRDGHKLAQRHAPRTQSILSYSPRTPLWWRTSARQHMLSFLEIYGLRVSLPEKYGGFEWLLFGYSLIDI